MTSRSARPAAVLGLGLAFASCSLAAPATGMALPTEPATLVTNRSAAPGPGQARTGASSPDARVERVLGLMGTTVLLEVEARDRAAAFGASESAIRALEAAEARLSTWRDDSELARLNRQPAGHAFPLSPALRSDLDRALYWWRETGGAFDPGVGGLVRAWGLREGGRQVADGEIDEALAAGGGATLELGPAGATRTHPALLLEEGAFGKGVALDDALAALADAGATRAVIDLGGEVAVLGTDAVAPSIGAPYRLDVAHPRRRERTVLELAIDRGAVATTGNSERGIVVEGERLGHVLDPRTGRPAPDFGSLTVWAPDATAADCLSTGLYVMGPDAALRFAAAHDGIEVLVLEVMPAGLRARATPGLRGRLAPLPGGPSRIDYQATAAEPTDGLGAASIAGVAR